MVVVAVMERVGERPGPGKGVDEEVREVLHPLAEVAHHPGVGHAMDD